MAKRSFYYRASSYASAVLAVAILSVCLSVTRVLCDKTKQCTADMLIPHEMAITLISDTKSSWRATSPSVWNLRSVTHPFEKRRLRQMSAYNVSSVKDSEKSLIMTNRKSTTGFPTSYRWSAYITPKSSKGWLKKRFFVCFKKIKFNFNRIKSATKFLCVKTSSGKVVV